MNIERIRKLFILLGILAYIPVAAMLDPILVPYINDIAYMAINAVLLLVWGFFVGKVVNRWIGDPYRLHPGGVNAMVSKKYQVQCILCR